MQPPGPRVSIDPDNHRRNFTFTFIFFFFHTFIFLFPHSFKLSLSNHQVQELVVGQVQIIIDAMNFNRDQIVSFAECMEVSAHQQTSRVF